MTGGQLWGRGSARGAAALGGQRARLCGRALLWVAGGQPSALVAVAVADKRCRANGARSGGSGRSQERTDGARLGRTVLGRARQQGGQRTADGNPASCGRGELWCWATVEPQVGCGMVRGARGKVLCPSLSLVASAR